MHRLGLGDFAPDKLFHIRAEVPQLAPVHDWLLRGGHPTDKGIEKLHAAGVKTIISLRRYVDPGEEAAEKAMCEKLGIKLVNIPMSEKVAPSGSQIEQFMSAVQEGKQSGKVFVHCKAGMDRTGC